MKAALLVSLFVVAALPVRLWSQSNAPIAPRCYRLTQSAWSRSLGVNAAYHVLPAVIRLDTVRAAHGGWRVAPDIAFPGGSHFPGTPRWAQHADSIEIVWSNGYQVTTLSLGASRGGDRRGVATARSDANEFATDVPHATIEARRTTCAGLS